MYLAWQCVQYTSFFCFAIRPIEDIRNRSHAKSLSHQIFQALLHRVQIDRTVRRNLSCLWVFLWARTFFLLTLEQSNYA